MPSGSPSAIADIRDEHAVAEAAREAKAVFHFAAQVAVTTSLDDPIADLQVNLLGTRDTAGSDPPAPRAADLRQHQQGVWRSGRIDLVRAEESIARPTRRWPAAGSDEDRTLCFCTPYGCSKGGADQYVLDYAHSFGVPTAVLRMSCIYGPRQMGTEDQGWVAHFVMRALAGETDHHLRRRPAGARHPVRRRRGGRLSRRVARHPPDRAGPSISAAARSNAVSLRRADPPSSNSSSAVACRCAWRTGGRTTSAGSSPMPGACGRSSICPPPVDWRIGIARPAARNGRRGSRSPHEGGAGQSALALRRQHLFRLPRAASAAGTRLCQLLLEAPATSRDVRRPLVRVRRTRRGRAGPRPSGRT